MKLLLTIAAVSVYQAVAFALPASSPIEKRETVQGFDISHYQSSVNFRGAYSSGARFVIIKVSIVIHQAHRQFTDLSAGHRRHHLHRPRLLHPLHRRHLRRPHPGRIPLRPPRQQLRRHPSQLFPRAWRRLVRRRPHLARNARHRIQPLGRDMLRPLPDGDGELDLGLRQYLPQQDDALADDLHY